MRGPAWTTPGDNCDAATQTDGTAARVRMWWGALSRSLPYSGHTTDPAPYAPLHTAVIAGITAVYVVFVLGGFGP